MRNSTLSSKSLTVPPRQMRKLFSLTTFSGVVSPTIEPFSARQNVGSPSHPFSVLPSKIGTNPASSSGSVSGKSPPRRRGSGPGGAGVAVAAPRPAVGAFPSHTIAHRPRQPSHRPSLIVRIEHPTTYVPRPSVETLKYVGVSVWPSRGVIAVIASTGLLVVACGGSGAACGRRPRRNPRRRRTATRCGWRQQANGRRIGAAVQSGLLLERALQRDHRSRIQLPHRRVPR